MIKPCINFFLHVLPDVQKLDDHQDSLASIFAFSCN